ncbi:MAG: ABC transporter permease [Flavobacteriaceae bacterium]|nr:ABC transporter permease [Flavobacteriaceae bacterium]
MLMVSNLVSISKTTAHTNFYIDEDCIFITNKFLSETGLIENAAQSCSAIVGQSYFEKDDVEGKSNNIIGYISAIKKVTLYGLPKVGDTIVTKASLISRVDTGSVTMCSIASTTFNINKIIVDCTLNFLIHEVK